MVMSLNATNISSIFFITGRLIEAQRHDAIGMETGGMSFPAMARLMHCSDTTIIRLVQRHRETGSVADVSKTVL